MPETNICQYYPPWFRRILDFQALCQTEKAELDAMAEAMDQIRKNLFVQTMDEGTCAQWEAILRILPTPEETLDFRRLRVQNRLSLRPPFTLIFLREKLDLLFGPGNYEVEVDYPNYILGQWRLGEKPFVTYEEQEVLKLETTPSVTPALLNQTAAFAASDVASVRINGGILITALTRSAAGNVGSVSYSIRREQAEEVTLAELLDKDGNVLSSSPVVVPVLEDTVVLRHSFTVKEGT